MRFPSLSKWSIELPNPEEIYQNNFKSMLSHRTLEGEDYQQKVKEYMDEWK